MSAAPLLDRVASPEDLRALAPEDVAQVVAELRREIIDNISRTGGHLASSLGSVELITAIHRVFDTPRDRLVLDVGHQGYAHKMLTGRREGFDRTSARKAASPSSCAAPSRPSTTSAPATRARRSRRRSAWPAPCEH